MDFDAVSRYTEERFLHGIGDPMLKEMVSAALASGYQIEVSKLPYAVVPAILILACYGRVYEGAEVVDDYDALLQAHREAIAPPGGQCAHPDLYLASCIVILHDREQFPCYEAFADVGIPELFESMVHTHEER